MRIQQTAPFNTRLASLLHSTHAVEIQLSIIKVRSQ